ncbi:MAG TPA: DUF4337 domain-containing protein, partial [Terracidiphilus sp.]|nr:DUF4337 domain-containing protein [Terracidiphilus sp.]
ELKETAEKGSENQAMRPVAFTMSVLAVLVAVTTVLGHRTHTEAILFQTRAAVEQNRTSDDWALYQAKKIRSSDTDLAARLLHDLAVADKQSAKKDAQDWADHQSKWADDLKQGEEQAHEQESKVREFEKKVDEAEARANRFDLAEALLEIGLVITSVTLLTRSRVYWYFGFAFAAAGIVSVALGFLLK